MNKKILVLIFIVSFFARFAFLLTFQNTTVAEQQDAKDYQNIAVSLINGEGFVSNGVPTHMRLPLYPMFLASVYKLFGQNDFAVKTIQAVISAGTVVIMVVVAETLFGAYAALIAGMILAFYPPLILYSNLRLNETLFTFLLSGEILFLLRAFEKRKISYFCFAGIFHGLTLLCRSTLVFFPVFLLPLLLFKKNPRQLLKPGFCNRRENRGERGRGFFDSKSESAALPTVELFEEEKVRHRSTNSASYCKFRVKGLAIFTIIGACFAGAWTIRNYNVFNKFLLLNTGGGYLIWQGSDYSSYNGDRFVERDPEAYYPELKDLHKIDYERVLVKNVMQYAVSHPVEYAKLMARNAYKFWCLPVGKVMLSEKSVRFAEMYQVLFIIMLMFSLYGLLCARNQMFELMPLLLFLIYISAMHSIIISVPRLRLPFETILLIFAANGIAHLLFRRKFNNV